MGITYYLVWRLSSSFSREEIDFYWPQYWCVCACAGAADRSHLLVTKPSSSRALECFILRRCEESVHTAFLTLWYFQALLADLAGQPHSPAFLVCRRVYNQCQRILFEEPHPATEPLHRRLVEFIPLFEARSKVSSDHALTAAVGIGASIASIGSPRVGHYGASIAIQQGRDAEASASPAGPRESRPASPPAEPPAPPAEPPPKPAPRKPPSRTEQAVGDVFGQHGEPEASRVAHARDQIAQQRLHSASLPDLAEPLQRTHRSLSSTNLPGTAQALPPSSYSYAVQRQYLRSHYGWAQMQLLQALQDIPARLQQLPKPARLSALRGELTALNHNLPTEACFPMWCAGDCEATSGGSERHHRLVRISASEAVVLNSADRVPYLLHVEVLRNDLDFDPNRRYNRELLSRMFGQPGAAPRPAEKRGAARAPPPVPTPKLKPAREEPDEGSGLGSDAEMDLTEQMYGADLAAFGPVTEEAQEEGLGEKNRALDTAAWTLAPSEGGPGDISLEEYSQRMRTAAVMLAQLNKNANAISQNVTAHAPHVAPAAQGGWASWIVGTAWSGAEPAANGQGPQNGPPSEAGGAPLPPHETPGGTAKVIYADTEVIRKKIMHEMMALEEGRMKRMQAGGKALGRRNRHRLEAEDETAVMRAVNKDDPSAAFFKESWTAKRERIRGSSPYGHLPNWELLSVIVKTGADLRQEQFAVQLINEFGRVWRECGNRCWVRDFRILVLNEDAGLIETITDAVSVHSIKKDAYARQIADSSIAAYSLYDHFLQTYGDSRSPRFRRARRNFTESLAGYAIVSYLLQIKDRHNGNILVDTDGHLIHIDFGFILGVSPGGVGFEAAPFKLPRDYIDILGGMDSEGFQEFRMLMRQGFRDVRKHAERFIMLVELMQEESRLPCFALGDMTAANLRDRFQLALTGTQCDEFVDRLILSAAGSAFTRLYDQYQKFTQNIL